MAEIIDFSNTVLKEFSDIVSNRACIVVLYIYI